VPADEQPFADLAPLFDRADIVIGNLESPVVAEPDEFHVTGRHVRPGARWSLTFRADPAELPLLAVAGFDVLSLANNHARDLGPRAVAASRRNVEAAGLLGIGAGRTDREARAPAVIEQSGVRVAIIARTVWLKGLAGETDDSAVALLSNRRLVATVTDEIRTVRADTGADFVVVSIHWGHEYELEPDDSQRRAAHAMIDAGADVVIGHHPHVVQTFERYRGGVIAYSLGNFLFDTGGREPRRSAVLELALDASGDEPRVAGARLHPVLIHPDSRAPRLARHGGYRAWARDLAERAPAFEIAAEPAQ
jgi:poly-gamma-glutamate synthesis protein (capsule biosynthesis protein)